MVGRGLLQGTCLLFALGATAEDWPRWRGPDLNGMYRERDWMAAWPQDGPKQLWSALVGIGFSSVTLAQGRVFTLGNTNATDAVFCFDAATGKELWRHSYECPGRARETLGVVPERLRPPHLPDGRLVFHLDSPK